MNKRVIFTAILGISVVALLSLWFIQPGDPEKVVSDEVFTEFHFEDTAAVDRIEITETILGLQVTVERGDKYWLADGKHRVRKDLIDLILNTFKTIRFKNYVPKASVPTYLKELSSSNKEVKIYMNGEHKYTWYIGNPNKTHDGTVMLLEKFENGKWYKSKEPVEMGALRFRGELRTRFSADINEWRYTGIFNYHPSQIQSVKVTYSDTERNKDGFEIKINEKQQFELLNYQGQHVSGFDTSALRRYVVHYKKVHFETFNRIYDDTRKDSLKNTPPLFTIEVKTTNEKKRIDAYRIKSDKNAKDITGDKIVYDLDRMHAFIGNDMVVIQYFVFDPLTKKISDFIPGRMGVENNSSAVNNTAAN